MRFSGLMNQMNDLSRRNPAFSPDGSIGTLSQTWDFGRTEDQVGEDPARSPAVGAGQALSACAASLGYPTVRPGLRTRVLWVMRGNPHYTPHSSNQLKQRKHYEFLTIRCLV